MSNSFGEPESGSSASFRTAFNHHGTVITASAGDDGYYSYDQLSAVNQPNIPAAYNTTVSVGGTSLYLGQTATRQSESVWNDNGPRDVLERDFGQPLGAGGGGCSTILLGNGIVDCAYTAAGSVAVGDRACDALAGFDGPTAVGSPNGLTVSPGPGRPLRSAARPR